MFFSVERSVNSMILLVKKCLIHKVQSTVQPHSVIYAHTQKLCAAQGCRAY